MRVFGLLAWHGWEYTRTAPCFLWIEGWPRQPGGLHPTGGSRRVFRQFAWLGVGSVKVALSRPTHQRVTQAVGRFLAKHNKKLNNSL